MGASSLAWRVAVLMAIDRAPPFNLVYCAGKSRISSLVTTGERPEPHNVLGQEFVQKADQGPGDVQLSTN
jgi:hypothetical protein